MLIVTRAEQVCAARHTCHTVPGSMSAIGVAAAFAPLGRSQIGEGSQCWVEDGAGRVVVARPDTDYTAAKRLHCTLAHYLTH